MVMRRGSVGALRRTVGSVLLVVSAGGCGLLVGENPTNHDAGLVTESDASQLDASTSGMDASTPDASGTDGGRADGAVTRPDATVPLQPCSPELSVDPDVTAVLPLDLLTLRPSGGTGAYRFELTTNASGAIIHQLTGAYLSGELTGAMDIVTVTDDGCIGSVTATVNVVAPMQAFPTNVEIPPDTSFTFEVTNGLGPYGFELVQNPAGGTVSMTGQYSAGAGLGRDQVRITDIGSGQTVDAFINVVAGAALQPEQGAIYLPVGSTFAPSIRGGSGRFTGTVTGGAVSFTGGIIAALQVGAATIDITDAFTAQTTQLTAVVLGPQRAPSIRVGDLTGIASVVGPGDVDGDGFRDALLGVPESDVTGVQSGALYLYRGSATGLIPEPAHVYGGAARRDEYGRAVVTADFNRDGRVDLAVGAHLADVGATDIGSVAIHYGRANDVWSDNPDLLLTGRNASDQFGLAIASCDFNGDGMLDLAVGAHLAEDRTASPQSSNQGGVFIYLGYPDGFLGTPDMTVWGALPDMAGMWSGAPDLRIGNSLAAGDMDDDGRCDLAVGSLNYRFAPSGRSNDGAVFIYKGMGPMGVTPGGLAEFPSRAIAGISDDRSTQFGRYIDMGDIDGDGKADLAASQYLHDRTGGTDVGAVRVFAGTSLSDTPPTALAGAESADWTWEGPQAGDNAGWYVALADADGDGRHDVLSGNLRGEGMAPDGGVDADGGRIDAGPPPPNNAGSVTIFAGRDGLFPADTPSLVFGGLTAEDRFGTAMGVLGDVDGDGLPDLLAFAARGDAYGLDVGVPYFVPGDFTRAAAPLLMPGEGAGQQLGRDADVVGDVDGDGFEDLIVGAPLADPVAQGVNAGAAHLYKGSASGFSSEPDLTFGGYTGHSGSDQLGHGASRAGDFNNDGYPDIAIVARGEDRPNTFNATAYANPTECNGTRNDSGAVFVFLGKASGLPDNEPAFVWYGPQASQVVETIAGGFDFNGDGYDDLVVGSPTWDGTGRSNAGGFAVIGGRAAASGQITVICDSLVEFFGLATNDNVGRSVGNAGDINADGCGDVVVGANAEDHGRTDQGAVRVVFGFGGTGCPTQATHVLLVPDAASAQAGYAVDGAEDADGDSVPDIAVGGFNFRVGANAVGAAWIIPGAYIASLPAQALSSMTPTPRPFTDPGRMGTYRVEGLVAGERFGNSVAFVRGASGGNRAALAVGGPQGQLAGPQFTGGVRIFAFSTTGAPEDQGLQSQPILSMGGETIRAGSRVGETVRGGRLNNRSVVVVGALEANAVGLDEGAAFVIRMP